ncbi:MAG: hypothetical protein ABIN91_15605 [Mucilaginibacter sp.]|uniref:hypothetical protein n=1 Tax=Mucilaginibacter sp. TaxID=1882438 RepID=UPI0032652B6C
MKKANQLQILLAVVILFAACKPGPHVRMSINNNGNKTTMEYYGKIAFSEDNTSIKSMAKHSHIQFEKNGTKITAERDLDGITYKLNDGVKLDSLNRDQKQLIANIIREVHK